MSYSKTRYFKPKKFTKSEFSNHIFSLVGSFSEKPEMAHLDFTQWHEDNSSETIEHAKFSDLDYFCDLEMSFMLKIWFQASFKVTHKKSCLERVYIGIFGGKNSVEIHISADKAESVGEIFENLLSKLKLMETDSPDRNIFQAIDINQTPPLVFPELEISLKNFRNDYPKPSRCAFIIMQFQEMKLHKKILTTIKSTCKSHSIIALRADEKYYSDDLLPNVRTYMHGCDFGIAIFERLTSENFNPNVS